MAKKERTKREQRFHLLWKKYYKPTYRLVAFALCAFVMVLCFPRVGTFSYEYEIQRPWRYADVIAPYDFPIFKTAQELQEEKDSVLAQALPIYTVDSVEAKDVAASVDDMLRGQATKIQHLIPASVSTDTLRRFLRNAITNRLMALYAKGVVEVPQTVDAPDLASGEIILIRSNVMEVYSLNNLLTLRKAYSAIISQVTSDVKGHYGGDFRWISQLIQRLPFDIVVVPNVHYNETKTNLAKADMLNGISETSGMVMAGLKIIGTGDVVDRRSAKVLDSLKRISEDQSDKSRHELPIMLGESLMVMGLLLSVFLFLYYYRRDYFRSLHYINLILMLMTLFVCLTGLLAGSQRNISFIIPYTVLPIVFRLFADSRLAMYVHTMTILIISSFAYNSQLFIFLHIPAGIVACVALYNLNKRSQLVRTALYIFLYYLVMYVGYTTWKTAELSLDRDVVIQLAISCTLLMLVYPLIYIVEKLFGFVSDVTLLEMSDSNNVLLRQLSEKAPGTFQHSMQVSNLAQEVAYKIGGNPLLVRVGSLYHDIGKIAAPLFFTENQVGRVNAHEGLDYVKSAEIIISHVAAGVDLARKYKLPRQVQEMIASHHGTSMARYFFVAWCNAHPGEKADKSKFSYPGPLPKTKEQAIVMMADAVEASSKSLQAYDDETIDRLVERIVRGQVEAHQFDYAPITFNDIAEAKKVLKEKLKNIYHARIQYPDLKESAEE